MTVVYIDGTEVSTKDERCILYTSDVQSAHQYVHVSRGPHAAFAQLRCQVDGSAASYGLIQALQLSERLETLQVDSNSEDKHDSDSAPCECKCGAVTSVRVAFLNRTRPPNAVLRGMQNIASRLLDGVIVWTGRRSSVNWMNCRDVIKFVDVTWGEIGSGCCEQLGMISSKSEVILSFEGDEKCEIAKFKSLDEYIKEIATEVGGVERYARSLLLTILQRYGSEPTAKTIRPSVGALICGLPGIGKTALAKAICKCLGVNIVFLAAADIFQTYVGHSEKYLLNIFDSAVQQAPSILLVDGIEAIAGNRRDLANSGSALEIGVLGALLSSLEKLKASNYRVFVLCTTNRPGDVDAAVLTNGRIDRIVNIEPPTQRDRSEILRIMTKSWRVEEIDHKFLNQLSERTGGFVGADLLSLCQRAFQACLNEMAISKANDTIVSSRHFEQALTTTYPSVLQTYHVSQKQHQPTSTSVEKLGKSNLQNAFSSIFGMDYAIQSLRVSLLEPLQDCSRFLKFGTTPPKGILITGPPGSGKTHLANAVAEEVRSRGLASFVSVQCSDLLTKIVGDTEKGLRELFDTARNAAPCVLYFDQIESIAPLRGFDTSTEQTFDRMLSMLLVEIDGFHTSQVSLANDEAHMAFLKQHVVILASTTNKELLDPAILRPGRFDVHIRVELPDENARYAIIAQALAKVSVDYSSDSGWNSPGALARHMAKHTNGLSAADINAILREAAMTSIRDNLDAQSIAIEYLLQALPKPTLAGSSTPSQLFASKHTLRKGKINPIDTRARSNTRRSK
ncbi:putative AAA+ ATPase domain, ATPase, AAA-type, core, AAA ATPase, AAA+ lid domain-containing protein [Plasmopara halstedii]